MSLQPSKAWQRRRAEFNHHWLKNRLLSALDCALSVLAGKFQGEGYLEELLDHEIREWAVRRLDLTWLLERFEADMSPRRVLEAPPMSEWEPELLSYLDAVLHEIWVAQTPVRVWITQARSASQGVDAAYADLLASAEGAREDVESLHDSFLAFRKACAKLARTIEQFPSQVSPS